MEAEFLNNFLSVFQHNMKTFTFRAALKNAAWCFFLWYLIILQSALVYSCCEHQSNGKGEMWSWYSLAKIRSAEDIILQASAWKEIIVFKKLKTRKIYPRRHFDSFKWPLFFVKTLRDTINQSSGDIGVIKSYALEVVLFQWQLLILQV